MANNALKAQEKSQEVSNNSPELDKENGELISRQAVLDAIFSEPLYESGMKKRDSDIIVPAIYEKIKALPPSPSRSQWIPISERLPEHSCQTLVTTKWDTEYSVEYGFYWGEDNKWGTITNNVIAWMPLPEPYHRP